MPPILLMFTFGIIPSARYDVFAILLGKSVLLFKFVLAPGTPMVFSVEEWNLTIIVLFILVRFILLMLYMPTRFY